MKTKTYEILSHLPVIGFITKNIICDPTINCSPFLSSDLGNKMMDYKSNHPDIQITRKILKQIMHEECS